MDKQNKAFKVLEFDKILERLSSYTESKDVKKRIEEIGSVYGIRGRKGGTERNDRGNVNFIKARLTAGKSVC